MADAFRERQTTVDNETASPVNDFADAVVTLQPRPKRSQFRKMIRAQGRVVARCEGPGDRAGVGGIDILADHDDLVAESPTCCVQKVVAIFLMKASTVNPVRLCQSFGTRITSQHIADSKVCSASITGSPPLRNATTMSADWKKPWETWQLSVGTPGNETGLIGSFRNVTAVIVCRGWLVPRSCK